MTWLQKLLHFLLVYPHEALARLEKSEARKLHEHKERLDAEYRSTVKAIAMLRHTGETSE